MKPLKLTMAAFGCYDDPQTIDFTRLGASGLYLICGETGSGKTTIFDAISFALFGKASGSGRYDYGMLRSDFSDENAKTFVELDFLSGDQHYFIKRYIKNTGQDVVLTLPDGTNISGKRRVDEKITEVIGLDRDQFAQIVMIAQNDFLRFLQSSTDERLKILRRIFGTESLRKFQEYLKVLVKRESDRRNLIIHDFERHKVDIYQRDEQFKKWEQQIETDRKELFKTETELEQCDKDKQTLAAAFAVAGDLHKKFLDLAECRNNLDEHKRQADAIASIKSRAIRGETALRKVKPFADEAAKAVIDHANAEAALNEAREKEAAALAEQAKSDQAFADLPPLDQAKERLLQLTGALNSCEEKQARLSMLWQDQDDIFEKRTTLANAQIEFEQANAAFAAADGGFKTMEMAFLRNQAGILAGSLVNGMPCPVCGSTEHPAPAVLTEADISSEALKKSKSERDQLQQKREQKTTQCNTLNAELKTLTRLFLMNLSEYLPGVNQDESGSPQTIITPDTQQRFEELLLQTQKDFETLSDQKREQDKSVLELTNQWETWVKRKTDAAIAVKDAQVIRDERHSRERILWLVRNEENKNYHNNLQIHEFADEAEYLAALVTDEELENLKGQIQDYEKRGEHLNRDIERLEKETTDKEQPDLAQLQVQIEAANVRYQSLQEQRDELIGRINQIDIALKELRDATKTLAKVEEDYAAIKQLANVANGKLDFETYAQKAYFDRILRAANIRLRTMSQNRYTLLRKEEMGDGRVKTGLELEVLDVYTGKARSANSLSGGESFMASLSLALGLSDVVQQNAGGVHLDAMFIDEGFGTLDSEVLELSIKTLSEMAGQARIIGIISHVSELSEQIERQIQVEKTAAGSKISIIS